MEPIINNMGTYATSPLVSEKYKNSSLSLTCVELQVRCTTREKWLKDKPIQTLIANAQCLIMIIYVGNKVFQPEITRITLLSFFLFKCRQQVLCCTLLEVPWHRRKSTSAPPPPALTRPGLASRSRSSLSSSVSGPWVSESASRSHTPSGSSSWRSCPRPSRRPGAGGPLGWTCSTGGCRRCRGATSRWCFRRRRTALPSASSGEGRRWRGLWSSTDMWDIDQYRYGYL